MKSCKYALVVPQPTFGLCIKMGIGIGLGLPSVAVRKAPWYMSVALAALCAGFDFNKDEGFLPALGPELVTNPGFNSDTTYGSELVADGSFATGIVGWSAIHGTISHEGNRIRTTATDGSNPGRTMYTLTGLSVGQTYRFSFDRYKGTSAGTSMYVGIVNTGSISGAIVSSVNVTTDGNTTVFFTATQTDHYLIFLGTTSTIGAYAEFDNVSVKQITNSITGWDHVGLGHFIVTNGRLRLSGNGTNNGRARATLSDLKVGSTYQVSIDRYKGTQNATTFSIAISGATSSGAILTSASLTTEGTDVRSFTATQTTHWIFLETTSPNPAIYVEFDNVSVKEVLLDRNTYGPELIINGGFDTVPTYGPELNTATWAVPVGYDNTITTNTASSVATGAGTTVSRAFINVTTVVGQTYEVTLSISAISSGNFVLYARDASNGAGNILASSPVTNVGSYVFRFTATTTTSSILAVGTVAGGTFTITGLSTRLISNYSSMGWVLKPVPTATETMTISGNTLNLTGDGTNFAWADQSFVTVIGQRYLFVAVVGASAIGLRLGIAQGGSSLAAPVLQVGVHVFSFVALSTTTWLRLEKLSANLATVDNVSIKQITNWLPTGAELIANGTFDNDIDWTKVPGGAGSVTISGGVANIVGDGTNINSLNQQRTVVDGRTYEVKFTVASNLVNFRVGTSAANATLLAQATYGIGTHTVYFTASGTAANFWFGKSGATLTTIDNVSVRAMDIVGSYPKRRATREEFFSAYTALSTSARTRIGPNGTLRDLVFKPGAVNQLTNPSFTNGFTDWMADQSAGSGTLSLVGGAAHLSGGSTSRLRRAVQTVVGTSYAIQFVIGGDVSIARFHVGTTLSGSELVAQSAMSVGLNTFIFTATTTTTYIHWFNSSVPALIVDDVDLRESGVNSPRLTYANGKQQLRLENTTTNVVANNSNVGAVVGSPGTLPTGWLATSAASSGITTNVAELGTQNGMPYIDLRFTGTATAVEHAVNFNPIVTASPGQSWTTSAFFALVGGSAAQVNDFTVDVVEFSSTATFVALAAGSFVPTATLTRRTRTITSTNVNTASVRPRMRLVMTVGAVVDVTIRVALPQMEQSAFASDPIVTSGAAVIRNLENFRYPPIVEAILQRSAGSVVVRGQKSATQFDVILGAGSSSSSTLINGSATSGRVTTSNGAVAIGTTGPTPLTQPFGTVIAFDATGRTIAVNSTSLSDANTVAADRSSIYLARFGGTGAYADMYADFIGVAPDRLLIPTVQTLSVAA